MKIPNPLEQSAGELAAHSVPERLSASPGRCSLLPLRTIIAKTMFKISDTSIYFTHRFYYNEIQLAMDAIQEFSDITELDAAILNLLI